MRGAAAGAVDGWRYVIVWVVKMKTSGTYDVKCLFPQVSMSI